MDKDSVIVANNIAESANSEKQSAGKPSAAGKPFPWADVIVSIVCWLLAAYILLTIRDFQRLAGAVEVLGSDFVPRLLSYCFVIFGIWLMASAFVGRGQATAEFDSNGMTAKLSLLAIVLAYTFLLPIATFLPSTVLLIVVVMRLFGEKSLFKIIATSIIVTAAIYYIFGVQLKIPLP